MFLECTRECLLHQNKGNFSYWLLAHKIPEIDLSEELSMKFHHSLIPLKRRKDEWIDNWEQVYHLYGDTVLHDNGFLQSDCEFLRQSFQPISQMLRCPIFLCRLQRTSSCSKLYWSQLSSCCDQIKQLLEVL